MSDTPQSTMQLVQKLSLVVVLMFGFGYLMVPIYNILCEVTGLNGKTGVVDASDAEALDIDQDREVVVEFVANLNQGARWEFKPEVTTMTVSPGKMYTTHYVARNLANKEKIGQAVPSVAPREASLYFNKTECFCFSQQTFAANEQLNMPLTFVVDPALPKTVKRLTLSYTFFNSKSQAES
ncbi:MAG: cytochrome c oxidase assembly protein [Pseudomonadota bacterium]